MPQSQVTRSAKTARASTGTPAANGTSNGNPVAVTACNCGCHEHAGQNCGCCKLTCFERPKYFCGQLLSDEDLTLQETYFREKNKLYHRTVDGFGVVCGLRMTRDFQSKSSILIGDGYAIDPCGNDLVVCEPRSFNVLGELRKKNWVVDLPQDRTARRQGNDDAQQPDNQADSGASRQCFYVGICYAEEPVDFTTPYTTECNPAPGPCQPTRIREGVRFELYDTLPERPNPLEDTARRIESCFKLFREGQFSRSLASMTGAILEVLRCDPNADSTKANPKKLSAQGLFKELQAQFLHELRTSPDHYNYDLERDVFRLTPPATARDNQDPGVALEAFTKLFELIQKHVFSSVLGMLTFSCPEPPDSCCVLIGSVEIENGSLTRVINYPRWYMWCFANFFEVLLYSMANDGACGKDTVSPDGKVSGDDSKDTQNGCCPDDYEVWVCQFLNLFSADPRAFEKAALTAVDAIQASYSALVAGFNFTRPGGIAPSMLRNLDREKAEGITSMLGLNFQPSTMEKAERRDVFAAIADNTIRFRSDTLVYDTDDSKDASGDTVSQVNGVIGAPTLAVGPFTHSMFTDVMERLTTAEARLNECEIKLAAQGGSAKTPSKNS